MFNLSQIPLFHSLPEDEFSRMAGMFHLVTVSRGDLILQEGQVSDRFYIILDGTVEIVRAVGRAEESVLGLRSPGEFIGEIGMLNQDGLRTATARAREDARLIEISYSDFSVLLARHPNLAYELASVLSSRFTEALNETIRSLREKNTQLQSAYDDLKAAQAQIVQKEKLERELQLAGEIQASILPSILPVMDGYDFGALMVPARAVGGDFFEIFHLDEQHMAIIVGDVTDKGVPAALFMAQTHALLRASAQAGLDTARTLERVNHLLAGMNDRGMFVTVLYGILNQKTGEFCYSRAGHELPLVLAPNGEISFPDKGKGIALGIVENPQLEERGLSIPPGGLVILYSDGVTDATNAEGRCLDRAGFVDAVKRLPVGLSAQEICKTIFRELEEFQHGEPQFDDVTIVAVRRRVGTEMDAG